MMEIGWDVLRENPGLLEPGDVISTSDRDILACIVKVLTRGPFEKPTWATHTGIVTESPNMIETRFKVKELPLFDYEGGSSGVVVTRFPGGLTEKQQSEIVAISRHYLNDTYGFWKLALHLGDAALGGAYFFRRLACLDNYPICSWVPAFAYHDVMKYDFGVPPNGAQPDDILDYCYLDGWDFVWADSEKTKQQLNEIYAKKKFVSRRIKRIGEFRDCK